jgi:Transposase DDE domain
MDRELASSTTTRILPAWPPSFEDWDPVGAEKNYDTAGFVASCRANRVTPHVAQNDGRGGGSAIDGRTTRWAGYAISQRERKCIEQVFGWSKTVGRIRQAMYRGRERVEQWFLLTQAAYNLTPPTPTLPRPTLK